MTYYIAKTLSNAYICINSDMYYDWFNSFSDVDPTNLPVQDEDDGITSTTIEEWLDRLNKNRMTLVLTFTRESHPELFL